MATLDAKMRALATRLISDKGKTATFTYRSNTGSYNYVSGLLSENTATVDLKISPPSPVNEELFTGQNILRNDAQFLVDAVSLEGEFTPVPEKQTVTIDSEVFSVVAVRPIYSGELIAAWAFMVRR